LPYKLLALDVDGTLLDFQSVLRPRVRAAVRAAAAAGCAVALATGRRYASAIEVAAELDLDTPLILHNGALIRRALSGTVLHEMPIDLPAARVVAETVVDAGSQVIVFPSPGAGELILAGPTTLDGDLAACYLDRCGATVERRPLDDLFDGVPPLTIVVMDDEAHLDALGARLAGGEGYTLTRNTFPLWDRAFHVLDVLAAGCSKAAGLRALAGQLGIALEDTVAVGDHWNDVEMIEAAGLGIAMGNAPPGVRARADRVTGSCEAEGLADALEALPFGG
jgi:Cof subfamily protein (haloacid dehalogenase superfamily)